MWRKVWRKSVPVLLVTGADSGGGLAHGYKVRTLDIVHPWTQPAANKGAALIVCMILKNKAARPDRLCSASSPAARAVRLQSAAAAPRSTVPFEIPAGA